MRRNAVAVKLPATRKMHYSDKTSCPSAASAFVHLDTGCTVNNCKEGRFPFWKTFTWLNHSRTHYVTIAVTVLIYLPPPFPHTHLGLLVICKSMHCAWSRNFRSVVTSALVVQLLAQPHHPCLFEHSPGIPRFHTISAASTTSSTCMMLIYHNFLTPSKQTLCLLHKHKLITKTALRTACTMVLACCRGSLDCSRSASSRSTWQPSLLRTGQVPTRRSMPFLKQLALI